MMGEHHHHAKAKHVVACAVVTVSDTRTLETDESGGCIRTLLEGAGHRVVGYTILPDEPGRIRAHLEELLALPGVDAVLVNGGTGLAPRDTTYEAVTAVLEKRLDGFGELFRMLSYEQIGSAAMMSRACAGTIGKVVVISLPGSEKAVMLAMTKLVLPELTHLVQQAGK